MTNDLTTIPPEIHTIDGLAIRVVRGARNPKLSAEALLLSPWPESLYAYEPTWAKLAEHANLMAIDLPGFGQSDGRESLMSPSAMGDFIVRIADELGLENPHAVGPDVGTSALLFAAARHPGRLRSVVVGTGGAAVPLELGEPLKGWVQDPDISAYAAMNGSDVVAAAISTLERYTPSDIARGDYLASYAGDRFYKSMSYARAYPRELPILRDLLSTIRTPVKIVSGAYDPVVPPVNATFIAERVPGAELAMVDAGHFIWEDGADAYAAEVTSWWDCH